MGDIPAEMGRPEAGQETTSSENVTKRPSATTDATIPPDPDPASVAPTAGASSQGASTSQSDVNPSPPSYHYHHADRLGPYNMAPIAQALPQGHYQMDQYHHGGHHQFNPTASPPMMQQMPQMHHYGEPGPMPMGNQQYYAQHQLPTYYPQPHPHQFPQGGGAATDPRHNMGYYPNHMVDPRQAGFYYPQVAQLRGHMAGQGVAGYGHQGAGNFSSARGRPARGAGSVRVPSGNRQGHGQGIQSPMPKTIISNRQTDKQEAQTGAVRGPPRKPKQSGHAIWIGNLPPQTELMSLVQHVTKETAGLESLFLISKSNCAFANFKTEELSAAAQQKLHESKFNSVRLVSRLRKTTAESSAGDATTSGTSATIASDVYPSGGDLPDSVETALPAPNTSTEIPPTDRIGQAPVQQDKFFVLKSLTVEDLERSVRTGVWATQSHNEEALSDAYKSCDNVYLVFSANKSGEYFGYARMASEINNDPAAAVEFAPNTPAQTDIDLPKAIPTEPTEFIPKGRIIDDSSRGTIFWELESDDTEDDSETDSQDGNEDNDDGDTNEEDDKESKAWGKPFNLEWLSTTHLPFYRTRGLRNPWNSNREVKIARDGTELEPSVGRKLIGLFNRPAQPLPLSTAPHGMVPVQVHSPTQPYER